MTKPPTRHSALVTVETLREPWEAQMLRGRLEIEGIPAFVAHHHHIGVNWPLSTALGWTKVQVPWSWRAEAGDVIARCRAGEYHDDLVEAFGDIDDRRCPRCGSLRWRRRATWPDLVYSLVLSTVALTPPSEWVYRCRDCGTRYRA